MARVMIIGYGPLPQPGLAITHSPSLRTRQILEGARRMRDLARERRERAGNLDAALPHAEPLGALRSRRA